MTVFVLYSSRWVGCRIMSRLAQLEGISIVGGPVPTPETAGVIGNLRPGLVVLDAEMASGASFPLLRRIKSAVPAPIVIMTAVSSNARYRDRCSQEGADFFYELPSQYEDLCSLVRSLAERGLH